jgi:CRP-like cAMP-binding protein
MGGPSRTVQEWLSPRPIFQACRPAPVADHWHGSSFGTLGPGDYFGEMALIDKYHRSAKITAETELRCLLFLAWVFGPFAIAHPETAWAQLEMMVQRVREAEAR